MRASESDTWLAKMALCLVVPITMQLLLMYQKPLKKPSGLILTAWEEELYDDPCRNVILDGIKNGFHIIDPTMSPQ